MSDYRLEIISSQSKLNALAAHLTSVQIIALDIETIEWWDRYRERIALIQIAFRTPEKGIKVAVIDPLAKQINLEVLRSSFESKELVKVIHNAAFDAAKLFKHYKFKLTPIFDTMTAARRSGEKRYSLAAQALSHLNLQLDKSVQRSDWSRRPLDIKQIDYAARDAYATLLLYEDQIRRNLTGGYRLKYDTASSTQGTSDLAEPDLFREVSLVESTTPVEKATLTEPLSSIAETVSEIREMALEAKALLSIVSRLPDRYSPAQLVSFGGARTRRACWLDRRSNCRQGF